MRTTNLHKARKAKNDEFYTQLSDIENEMKHYKEHFIGKTIYCNCDNPEWSNFYKYFSLNFEFLQLKKLITTHFEINGSKSYKLELTEYGKEPVKTPLEGNGDFRSDECVNLLKESDIVITNPPFSLFREYVDQLITNDKKFIIVGNMNAISYKEVFKYIKNNKLWLGNNNPKVFREPNGNMKNFRNIIWYQNLNNKDINKLLILNKTYIGNEYYYPKYDNYDAINVDKVKDIPCDYDGFIGVPITFLFNYNNKQFEIIDISPHFFEIISKGLPRIGQLKLKDRKDPYVRIIIKRK